MKGCGCLLAIATGLIGFFFWPLWLLTIAGVLMYAVAPKEKETEE
jgi:hypothetical protein